MFVCRLCLGGTIDYAELRQGSNLTFLRQLGLTRVNQLVARERSQVNIENNSPDLTQNDVTLNDQNLAEDSMIYESIFGQ